MFLMRFSRTYNPTIKMIRYIEERDRENLANFVSGLYAVCNLVGSGTGSGDRCLNILQLSNYETNTESGASNSEVESAAKNVIGEGPFSMFRSERNALCLAAIMRKIFSFLKFKRALPMVS